MRNLNLCFFVFLSKLFQLINSLFVFEVSEKSSVLILFNCLFYFSLVLIIEIELHFDAQIITQIIIYQITWNVQVYILLKLLLTFIRLQILNLFLNRLLKFIVRILILINDLNVKLIVLRQWFWIIILTQIIFIELAPIKTKRGLILTVKLTSPVLFDSLHTRLWGFFILRFLVLF